MMIIEHITENSLNRFPLFFPQATDFLFQVFAAAVVSWGDHLMPLLLGIRAQWFPWQPGSKPRALPHILYGQESLIDHALPQCLLGVSHSLALLLDKEPWSGQTQKVCVSASVDKTQVHIRSLEFRALPGGWRGTQARGWSDGLIRIISVSGQCLTRQWQDVTFLFASVCVPVHRLASQHHRMSWPESVDWNHQHSQRWEKQTLTAQTQTVHTLGDLICNGQQGLKGLEKWCDYFVKGEVLNATRV